MPEEGIFLGDTFCTSRYLCTNIILVFYVIWYSKTGEWTCENDGFDNNIYTIQSA